MRLLKPLLGLCLLISLLAADKSLAQPKITKDFIKADLPDAVKKELEKLYSTDPVQRGNGCLKLGEMGSKGLPAVPFLAAMLADQASVRRSQVVTPGSMPASPGFELSVSLGALAGEALGKIGGAGVTALVQAFKDKNPVVRANATAGLGESKDPRAVEQLTLALGDSAEIVRARAATGLGKIGDKRAIPSLLTALKDISAPVREAATLALGGFKEDNTAILIVCLSDPNRNVRTAAAVSLGKSKSKEAIKPLIGALQDNNPKVRAAAAAALGKLKDKQALEPLISSLHDNDPGVRRTSAGSLGELQDARAVPQLIEALKELKDPELVAGAAAALKKITGQDFGKDIIKWQTWWEENRRRKTES